MHNYRIHSSGTHKYTRHRHRGTSVECTNVATVSHKYQNRIHRKKLLKPTTCKYTLFTSKTHRKKLFSSSTYMYLWHAQPWNTQVYNAQV